MSMSGPEALPGFRVVGRGADQGRARGDDMNGNALHKVREAALSAERLHEPWFLQRTQQALRDAASEGHSARGEDLQEQICWERRSQSTHVRQRRDRRAARGTAAGQSAVRRWVRNPSDRPLTCAPHTAEPFQVRKDSPAPVPGAITPIEPGGAGVILACVIACSPDPAMVEGVSARQCDEQDNAVLETSSQGICEASIT
jgi:hypothetical protein